MEVKIIASGSTGNCAMIDGRIMIDAGVRVQGFYPAAILITHAHFDHVCRLPDYPLQQILSTYEVVEQVKEAHSYARCKADLNFCLDFGDGRYKIATIQLRHDVPCVGFDITYTPRLLDKKTRILWLSDFSRIIDAKHIEWCLKAEVYDELFIECNNTLSMDDMLEDMFADQPADPTESRHKERAFNTHFSAAKMLSLFRSAGFSEEKPCPVPLTLLHKSSKYYDSNAEVISKLCKIANVQNP